MEEEISQTTRLPDADETSEIPPNQGVEMCPFCKAQVAPDAVKCPYCASNIGDIRLCPSCAEPVRAAATICPFCRSDLRPARPRELDEMLREPWVVYSSPFGAMLLEQSATALVFPPVLTITPSEIRIRRRFFFGLRTSDQNISVTRVASVRATSGIVWGGIVVETYGGAAGVLSINGLDKQEARDTAMLIEKLAGLKTGDAGR
jgi:hypothetical protein